MAEATQDYVYTESLKALQKRMQLMFNNKKHSDTVFTVKKEKFYAISEVVSVASSKLDAVISEHFAHCEDKKIKLYDVKCEKSFLVILQYMYGLDINFSELTIHVLCGVINLAVTYQLDAFAKDLKSYLSKVDKFEMDSLAVLLNTARKYNLEELYGKLKVFAYEHAEDFVQHDSIVHLLYECLLDLIKSDWFCAPEIDILRGVLNWHTGMNTKEKREPPADDDDDVKMEDSNDDKCSVASDCGTDQMSNIDDDTQGKCEEMEHVESTQVESCEHNNAKKRKLDSADQNNKCSVLSDSETYQVSNIDNDTQETCEDIEHVDSCEHNNANEQNMDSADVVEDQKDKCSELIKTFSEKVLKSLLEQIRGKQISIVDLINLFETREKHNPMLGFSIFSISMCKLFSQTDEPRQKHVDNVSQNGNNELSVTEVLSDPVAANDRGNVLLELNDFNKTFFLKGPYKEKTRYTSLNSYKWNDFKWIISIESMNLYLKVYLECTSDKEYNWECTTKCQLIMVSRRKDLYPNQLLPLKLHVFRKNDSCRYLGGFYNWMHHAFYDRNIGHFFEVKFHTIRATMK